MCTCIDEQLSLQGSNALCQTCDEELNALLDQQADEREAEAFGAANAAQAEEMSRLDWFEYYGGSQDELEAA